MSGRLQRVSDCHTHTRARAATIIRPQPLATITHRHVRNDYYTQLELATAQRLLLLEWSPSVCRILSYV